MIIELAYGSYSSLGYLVYLLAVIAACFTMLYSVKLIYLTFLTYANAPKGNYEKAHESPLAMSLPLIILGILSVYLGNISKDYFIGLGSQGLGNSIFTHPNHVILTDTEFGVPTFNKLLPLILSMICAILALYLFERKPLILLAINITVYVNGNNLTKPPKRLKSCWSPIACKTEPAAKNNPALYIACNTKCIKATLY